MEPSLRKLDLLHERRKELASEIALSQSRLLGIDATPGRQLRTDNELFLEQLRRQLTTQLVAHTEDHPNVIALLRQVQSLEEIVAEERAGGPGGSPALAAE